MQVHQQITNGQQELKKRSANSSVNEDGIPLDIEQHLNNALKSILNKDKDASEDND